NPMEYPVVAGGDAFGFVAVLHGAPDDDVPVPTEHVHGPVIRASAAEEIKLLGERSSQDNKMPAPRQHLIVLYQSLCAIPGAVDDDVFFELRKRLHIDKYPLSKPYAASSQIRDQSRQQEGRFDQPSPVFASRRIELLERNLAGPGFRHHVVGRVGIECGNRMVEGIIASECNSVMRPSCFLPELDYSVA